MYIYIKLTFWEVITSAIFEFINVLIQLILFAVLYYLRKYVTLRTLRTYVLTIRWYILYTDTYCDSVHRVVGPGSSHLSISRTNKAIDGISVAEAKVKVRKKSRPRCSDSRMSPSKTRAHAMNEITKKNTVFRRALFLKITIKLSLCRLVVLATTCKQSEKHLLYLHQLVFTNWI